MHSIQFRFLALALCAALCAACADDSTPDPAPAPPPAKPQSTAEAQAELDKNLAEDADKLTADMVRGVSPGKPTAPVELKFSLPAKPRLGTPLSIDIAVITTLSSDGMTLSAQASEGLEVDAGTSLANFPKSPSGTLYRHKLRVTPRAEGAFSVNVLVTTVVPGSGAQSRSFSIPLLVGGVAALDKPLPAPTSTDSSGERISSSPAVETTQ
jgi:hypothetical protein